MNSALISQGPRMSSTHLFSPALGASVMADVTPIVFVVDDDVSVRIAATADPQRRLATENIRVRTRILRAAARSRPELPDSLTFSLRASTFRSAPLSNALNSGTLRMGGVRSRSWRTCFESL